MARRDYWGILILTGAAIFAALVFLGFGAMIYDISKVPNCNAQNMHMEYVDVGSPQLMVCHPMLDSKGKIYDYRWIKVYPEQNHLTNE